MLVMDYNMYTLRSFLLNSLVLINHLHNIDRIRALPYIHIANALNNVDMNRFSSYKENFILKKIVDRNLISISMYYTQRNFIIFSPILSLHILKIPHAMTRK